MRKYKEYTDEQIIEIAGKVFSMAQLLKELGLRYAGGNYANMRKTLQRLNLVCSHWTKQGWSKDKQLKNWQSYNRIASIKKHLIKLRWNQCERCTLENWLGEPINLEIHHIDGDRTNNELENLQLLCPNCHSVTPNFRNRKSSVDFPK